MWAGGASGGDWRWIPLTLCQRQGKGGGHLAGRTCGGSSCYRGGGRGGGGTGDWAFRHDYTHAHTKWINGPLG